MLIPKKKAGNVAFQANADGSSGFAIFIYMGVSKNSDTPKWMVYNGKPYFLMDDLGVPLFLDTPMYVPVFLFWWKWFF